MYQKKYPIDKRFRPSSHTFRVTSSLLARLRMPFLQAQTKPAAVVSWLVIQGQGGDHKSESCSSGSPSNCRCCPVAAKVRILPEQQLHPVQNTSAVVSWLKLVRFTIRTIQVSGKGFFHIPFAWFLLPKQTIWVPVLIEISGDVVNLYMIENLQNVSQWDDAVQCLLQVEG